MNIPPIFKKWKKLIIWIWGIIVIFSVLLTIYSQFFDKKPNISFQIISEVNVLDVHEPLEDLKILFQGDDIQEKNLNLRIYTVRIENNGKIDILQNHFDVDDEWGIKVEDARIIETRFVSSNSEYIESKLIPQIEEEKNTVRFSKIIFDQNTYFSVELLVLHDKNDTPSLRQIGKIAGIRKNESRILASNNGEPFSSTFFHGGLFVQIARIIFYFICFTIFFVVLIFLIMKQQDRKERKKRLSHAPRVDEPSPTTDNHFSTPFK